MKKMYYFWVNAQITSVNNEEIDYIFSDVLGVERKEGEDDAVFYGGLKSNLEETLKIVAKNNNLVENPTQAMVAIDSVSKLT